MEAPDFWDDIEKSGQIIFDAEQGGAVAQILGDAHEVTPRG